MLEQIPASLAAGGGIPWTGGPFVAWIFRFFVFKKAKSDGPKLNDGTLGQAVSSKTDISTNQIKQTLSSSYLCMCVSSK